MCGQVLMMPYGTGKNVPLAYLLIAMTTCEAQDAVSQHIWMSTAAGTVVATTCQAQLNIQSVKKFIVRTMENARVWN